MDLPFTTFQVSRFHSKENAWNYPGKMLTPANSFEGGVHECAEVEWKERELAAPFQLRENTEAMHAQQGNS